MLKIVLLWITLAALLPAAAVLAQPDPARQAVVIDSQTGVTGGPSAVVYQTKPHVPAKNASPSRPGIPPHPARPAQPARPQDNTSNSDESAPITPVIVIQPKVPGG